MILGVRMMNEATCRKLADGFWKCRLVGEVRGILAVFLEYVARIGDEEKPTSSRTISGHLQERGKESVGLLCYRHADIPYYQCVNHSMYHTTAVSGVRLTKKSTYHTTNKPTSQHTTEKIPILGHAGTGKFWDDEWALVSFPASSFETAMTEWKMLDTVGLEKPAPCGWFLSSSYVSLEGKTHIVLTGGLLSTNECSGEVWVGDIQF
ncbi:hypothetical protein EDD15DRAFT_2420245 [Pisolithus albus]|nr:hypothetical protein EDD15DRAFT_2420245 [Pisolithus albus]